MLVEKKKPNIDKIKSLVVCPVELALRVLGGKWRGSVMYQLIDGPLRFNTLKYRVQDAVVDYDGSDNLLSNKVLSVHLTELIEYDLVTKEVSDSAATYALTARGKTAIPILLDLFEWGRIHF